MQRVQTTVIAVVGDEATACARALGEGANVRAVTPPGDEPPLDRAVAAWREAKRAHVPFLVHDADPLAAVAAAWVATYDQQGARGDLEVAVEDTLARWRGRSLELPDYYLVLGADGLPPTWRHWYLGVLHRKAPTRVVPASRADAAAGVRRLSAGRWWPDLDHLLAGVGEVVPDRV